MDHRKPHVLFVSEKWRNAHPNSPITNSQHNLFGSLAASDLATSDFVFYDEYHWQHQKPCDNYLIKKVMDQRPDVTFFCLIPWYQHIPSRHTISLVANYTKIVFLWADAVWPQHLKLAESYAPHAHLSVFWDVDVEWNQPSKHVHMWTPQDPRLYHDANLKRDINVSFIGDKTYPERANYLNFLERKIDINIAGGWNQNLSVQEYARILQRSKISLNFCTNTEWHEQLKGRIFEITGCGAMLMESRRTINWIDRWFMPEVDFVSFANNEELLKRIRYYLNNEQERIRIAQNGWRRTTEWYNCKRWWTWLFSECSVAID